MDQELPGPATVEGAFVTQDLPLHKTDKGPAQNQIELRIFSHLIPDSLKNRRKGWVTCTEIRKLVKD
jgi:hypothetical protein